MGIRSTIDKVPKKIRKERKKKTEKKKKRGGW